MLGKQLSPWTMSWFACAFLFLLAALAAAAMGVAGPGRWAGGLALAVVHLFTLGWLGQMMLGSLIQFVPVLAARPLILPRLSLPVLWLTSAGTILLAAGFLGLEGWGPGLPLLALAPLPLGAALLLAIAMLGGTLIAARSWNGPEGRAVMAALIALALLWISGAAMAVAMAGIGNGWTGATALLAEGLPLHVIAGAGGFLSLAAFGVSNKLFAMFLLAPERDNLLRRAGFVLALVALAALAAGMVLPLSGWSPAPPAPSPILAVILTAACLTALLYLADIRNLWRSRRRPRPEVNMEMTRIALGFLALGVVLLPPALVLGGIWAEIATFVMLAGWLSLLTLAQMIKIVSFLTWIQVFSPLIGRSPVPMVHDLTDAVRTRRWLWLWVAGVAGGTISLALASGPGFRLSALILLCAALGLGHEALAIRRLRHLPANRRPATSFPLILPRFRQELRP